ncbi:MAG: response regulator [Verrucomicrobiota bacterium]
MGSKILAIDDSPTLRKFISKHLTAYSENYEVLTAASGQEGVDLSKKEAPDLILLDFILPDFNGDDVCRKLEEDESTKNIPIILMSSSAPDIEKTESQFGSIVRSMIKPFSPQLLCAGVSFVLKKDSSETRETPSDSTVAAEQKPETREPASQPKSEITPSSDGILFAGKTSYFGLYEALKGIEEEKASGVLELNIRNHPHLVYFKSGLPHLVTTKDVDTYLTGGKLDIPEESQDYFKTLQEKQKESANPVFLQMAKDQALPPEQGEALTKQYGNFFFAEAWTQEPFRFIFRRFNELPDYIPNSPIAESMDTWATKTLRCVNAHSPAVKSIADVSDVLTFTAQGYGRVQELTLTEEEVSFATQLGEGGISVSQISEKLGMEVHNVHRILFLFMKTGVIDAWPAK